MIKKLLFILLMCLISNKSMANIGVFPQYADFSENSKKRSLTINVVNQSNHPQTYRVDMLDYTQNDNGRYIKAETVPNSAQKYLIYSPKQFTLIPGKVQAIRVARKGLGEAKDGEYVSHLRVSEVAMPKPKKNNKVSAEDDQNTAEDGYKDNKKEQTELSISVGMLFSISVPVTIYKGDDLNHATSILSHNLNGDTLNLVLQRKGNISSRINIKVFDTQGKQIGVSGPIRIYTPDGKRNLSIKLENSKKPARLELYDTLTKNKLAEEAL